MKNRNPADAGFFVGRLFGRKTGVEQKKFFRTAEQTNKEW
jgi:hypothetical protein